MNDLPTPIPSLRLISEQILRPNWHYVKDVGDCPYEVIANLLKLSTAAQLAALEERSPHLSNSTDHIWKELCVKDFVEVRKLVEDSGVEVSQSIDGSWKARYFEEEEKKQIKMSQVLERLRGQYHELDEKKQSRQTQSIDGLRLEKRRKLTSGSGHWGSSSRPKSLLEKARSNTKQITSIYAPKRKPVQTPSARKVPSVSSAFPSSRRPPAGQSHLPTPGSSRSPPPLALPQPSVRPVIKTVTRTTTTTKRSSALASNLPPGNSPRALPSGSHSRQNSFSPPPPSSASLLPPSRPISQLTPRSRALPPPPPPPPVSVSPSIEPNTASAKSPSLANRSQHSSPAPMPAKVSTRPSSSGPRVPKGLFIPKSTKGR